MIAPASKSAFLALSFIFGTSAGAQAYLPYKSIFCTVQFGSSIVTVNLHVPREGSGSCELIGMSPTLISGPQPPSSVVVPLHATSGMTVLSSNLDANPAHWCTRDFGTLTTLTGASFTDSKLLTYTTDGVIVVHATGISKIVFADLTPNDRLRIAPK